MPNRHGNAVRLGDSVDQYEVISDNQTWLLISRSDGSGTRWVRPTDLAAMVRPVLAWEPTSGHPDDGPLDGFDSLPDRATGSPVRVGDRVAYEGTLPRPDLPREGIVEGFTTIDGVIRVRLAGHGFPFEFANISLVEADGVPEAKPTCGRTRPVSYPTTPRRCTAVGYQSDPALRHGCRAPQRHRVAR